MQSLKTIADNAAADELTAQNILQFRNDTLSYRIAPEAWPQAKRGNIEPDKADAQAMLNGNYPDPFSNSTVIKYYLPEDKTGFIRITTIMGRQVELFKLNTTEQTIKFSRNHLANGMYIIQMIVDDKVVATDKMTLQ